jgi:hypothetical protein
MAVHLIINMRRELVSKLGWLMKGMYGLISGAVPISPPKRLTNISLAPAEHIQFLSGFGNHPVSTSTRFFFWLLSKDRLISTCEIS